MIGTELGSFHIESKIGAGAMGEVYRARHVKTGKPAAVKIIIGPQATKGSATERFEREAKILQQFRHENIVRFLALGKSKGIQYFAMEFVEGDTLDNVLAKKEVLPWQEVVDLSLQLCNALQYAHEHGVVHRDLKPSNVMVTADGILKLTDFGIAKDLDATALTAPNRTLGTAAYMAPEQIRGTPDVSHKTDLYALGCVMHQLLTGQTPFRGGTALVLMRAHAEEPPPRASERNPQVPKALDSLVLKLMAKSPTDRPWDAQAVATDLQTLKDKLDRGEPIKMAFGDPYISPNATARTKEAAESPPPDAALMATEAATSASRPSVTTSKPPKKKKKKPRSEGFKIPKLGTIGLVLALVALVALGAILMRPKSMDELYQAALPLMQSSQYEDWETAERRLAELEQRFPDNPHKNELQALHDKVILYKTNGRSKTLRSTLGKPQNDVESSYLATHSAVEEALKSHLDHVAMQQWLTFAQKVEQQDDPKLRGWVLLAKEQAATLNQAMEKQRKLAGDLLAQAVAAELEGQRELGASLRRKLLEEYGQFAFMGDILEVTRAGLKADEKPPDATPEKQSNSSEPGSADDPPEVAK